MERIAFGPDGLAPVVVQDRASGQVRMVAWASAEAVALTLRTGEAHFWSRSRKALWRKGETSGNTLRVLEVWADCDADSLLYLVDPDGPSCHTGRRTCFFRLCTIGQDGQEPGLAEEPPRDATPICDRLFETILVRRKESAAASYTRALLDGGAPAIGAKIAEEAGELVAAIAQESEERVVAEAADLVFHAMVGLAHRGLGWDDVARELALRAGRSGHAEKASRAR